MHQPMEHPRSHVIPSTQFQHRDVLIGFRSTYVPKPEGDAGPQSYAVRCSFHPPSTPPSIEVRRSLHKRYGRDFCRAQRKTRPPSPPPSQPRPPPSPPRLVVALTSPAPPSRRHVRSHSLTMLALGEHQPLSTEPATTHDQPTPGKHMRSRSFSISELTVSQLLEPPPPPSPPKTAAKPRVNTKWRTFGEHLWHQKSKMLLNALILTPPRHLYVERKNEVHNPLFHDVPCHSAAPTRCSVDDGANFDTFIAGYFRNMSMANLQQNNQPQRRESRRRPSTLKRSSFRETTETKWSRWRRYPENKRPEWTSLTSPTPAASPSMRRGGGVSYTDFLAHGNSYRQRAGLKTLMHQA